jgi:hypothetical protein
MKQDRFLTGILIGIGVLVVVALVVFFTRQDTHNLHVSDDTPEGVVHNYVLAVLNKDYEKAYGYLADLEYKPTYEEFRRSFLNGYVRPDDSSAVDVGESEIDGRYSDGRVSRSTIPATRSPRAIATCKLGHSRETEWRVESNEHACSITFGITVGTRKYRSNSVLSGALSRGGVPPRIETRSRSVDSLTCPSTARRLQRHSAQGEGYLL